MSQNRISTSISIELKPITPWLTTTYMQNVLRKHYKDESIKVLQINAKSATAKGENYTTDMQRIQVEFTSEQSNPKIVSLIVKTGFFGDDPATQFIKAYGIYEREMEMYTKILPKLTELLREIDDRDKIYPQVLDVNFEYQAIILEDLAPLGYTIVDRRERLDMKHAKLVLTKLAKIHATAAVLNERMPGIFAQNYDRGMFNRHIRTSPLNENMLNSLKQFVAQIPDLKAKYYEKISAMNVERVMEYGLRAFEVNNEHFMTLTHGDVWTNNMMFKYEHKNPVSLIPIDYQVCTWASPTIDLHYFFNTSLQEDLRLHAQPFLLKYYYDLLVELLRALKFRGHIPSLYKFRLEFEMRSFYGLFAALIFQPFMMCEDTDGADFNILASPCEKGVNYRNNLYKNIQIQKSIQHLLPIFDQKGLLDYME